MNRIKDLRLSNNWRQEDLAAKMNTAKSVISRYETGKLDLDTDLINRLCDLFSCTSDYLLGRSDVPYAVVTAEDAALLASYHSAPENVRAAISVLLSGESEHVEKKKAV